MLLPDDTVVKDDLAGALSVKFIPGSPVDEFLEKHIENYSLERYELFAVRVFYGKEIILTVFAVDKYHLTTDGEKLIVKKFKLPNVKLTELLEFVAEFNFTLSTGKYPLEDMVVVNK